MADKYTLKHNYDLQCPNCLTKTIFVRVVFDHFCLGGQTVECQCIGCGLSWFDDTLGVE